MGIANTERWERAHPPISGLDYFETELNQRDPFEFRNRTRRAKTYGIGLHYAENCMIPPSAVWSRYTYHGRQRSKLTFKVIQGHRLLLQSKAHIWLSISDCHLSFISRRLRDISSRTRSKTTPFWAPPDQGIPFDSNFVIRLGSQRLKALGDIY